MGMGDYDGGIEFTLEKKKIVSCNMVTILQRRHSG